ncbi:MAG: hypothetical protein JWO82_642 [Akkermansiaceae bacterium]|nr:hypothetical protein [Akkermansiaceae bacterium]
MKTRSQIPSILRLAHLCCLTSLGLSSQAFAQAGLTKVEINNPVVGTVVTNPDNSTTVTAGGGDTYDNADSFTYLYGQKTGDFDVKVKVLDVSADDPAGQQQSAKASLHVRANLTSGSPDIQVSATPIAGANYVETIARPAQDGVTTDPPLSAPDFRYFGGPYPGTFRPAAGSLYPVWLRVRRTANLFQTLCSQDNLHWTVLAEYSMESSSFPATVYVGLGAVAHTDAAGTSANRVRSTFSDYQDAANPPVPNDNGTPVTSTKPGAFPATVTSVNWEISLPTDGIGKSSDNTQSGPIVWNTGGFGTISRDLLLSINGQGPIPFSTGRYAAGAIDFGISPRDPVAAQSNLGPYSNPSRDRDTPAITDAASQAWFPSPSDGVIIPTARVNGTLQWNDGAAPFYPRTYEALDFSSAQYFDMDSGIFTNGVFYTRMAKLGETTANPNPEAGSSGGFQRAAFNIATAWFPYAQGWMAGSFTGPDEAGQAFWRSPGTHSAAATQGTLTINPNSAGAILSWPPLIDGSYGGRAALELPGIDSRDKGLLFLVPNDDGSIRGPQANCAVRQIDGAGWDIAIRGVAENQTLDSYMAAGQSEFSFLFIPYTATNLTGGRITGTTGAKANSAGTFTVTRTEAGSYKIVIPGKTGTDGMLILQPVGYSSTDGTLVDNNSLTYQYQDGGFVVQSRHLQAGAGPDGYDLAPLADSDFYFAFVDFTTPMSLGSATPTLPVLSLVKSGTSVTLSWPAAVTGYTLESSSTLAGTWTTVPGVSGNSVTLTITPALSKQFFRLRANP